MSLSPRGSTCITDHNGIFFRVKSPPKKTSVKKIFFKSISLQIFETLFSILKFHDLVPLVINYSPAVITVENLNTKINIFEMLDDNLEYTITTE